MITAIIINSIKIIIYNIISIIILGLVAVYRVYFKPIIYMKLVGNILVIL